MIAILDYGAGNVHSVQNALRRLGAESVLTADAAVLAAADKVIFPGVGAAGAAMARLRSSGLDTVIPRLRQPVLGICLGMQLLCRYSEEDASPCLGIVQADVRRFPPLDLVPHMGWNRLQAMQGPLFQGMEPEPALYFVHSYYVPLCAGTQAACDYILPFSAALRQDNFYAVQFHPEKSAAAGAAILQNFLNL